MEELINNLLGPDYDIADLVLTYICLFGAIIGEVIGIIIAIQIWRANEADVGTGIFAALLFGAPLGAIALIMVVIFIPVWLPIGLINLLRKGKFTI